MLLSKSNESFHMHHQDPRAEDTLSLKLHSFFPKTKKEFVVVCIGTDRATGDSFGPFVGTNLYESPLAGEVNIYGTLEHPVHAGNLEETVTTINKQHPHAFVIGIDASLGRANKVAHISVNNFPVKPGEAVEKPLPNVGHISITGIVNKRSLTPLFTVKDTRLFLVMSMARVTAHFVKRALSLYHHDSTDT